MCISLLSKPSRVTPLDIGLNIIPKTRHLLIVLLRNELSIFLNFEMTSQPIIVVKTNQFDIEDFGYIWEALVVHYFVKVFLTLFQPFSPNSTNLLVFCLSTLVAIASYLRCWLNGAFCRSIWLEVLSETCIAAVEYVFRK